MRNLLLFLSFFLVCTINGQTDKKKMLSKVNNPDKFFKINYEDLLTKEKFIGLKQLASKVDYIQLETNNDCLVNGLAKYLFSDSLIFINNVDHILKFSINGKFLIKIGSPGRGPGEIVRIMEMSVVPDKRLIVVQNSGNRNLLYYSFNGDLIKTIDNPSRCIIKVMNDGRYIANDRGSSISEKYTFRLTNETGDTISVVKNNTNWANPSGAAVVFTNTSFEPFYSYQNRYYFKTLYNDTVYVVNGNKIIPSYFVNLGKFKLPDENRIERLSPEQTQTFRDNSSKYYFAKVLEAGERIFLTTYSFGKGPIYYFVLDKKGLIQNLVTNYAGGTSIIINDWDGCAPFWPIGNINNNQVFMPIDVVRLKKFFDLRKSIQVPTEYAERQKQLENMISKLDIASNPIIMIVTLKPDI